MVPDKDALGRDRPLQLHHPDQLPGKGVHEVSPSEHADPSLHPSRTNRGVTDEIRASDRDAHWRHRAAEMGGG